jgi:hypothetical protein
MNSQGGISTGQKRDDSPWESFIIGIKDRPLGLFVRGGLAAAGSDAALALAGFILILIVAGIAVRTGAFGAATLSFAFMGGGSAMLAVTLVRTKTFRRAMLGLALLFGAAVLRFSLGVLPTARTGTALGGRDCDGSAAGRHPRQFHELEQVAGRFAHGGLTDGTRHGGGEQCAQGRQTHQFLVHCAFSLSNIHTKQTRNVSFAMKIVHAESRTNRAIISPCQGGSNILR